MSLPATSHRPVSPLLPLQQDSFSPSSIGFWVDLPPQDLPSDQPSPTSINEQPQSRSTRRRGRMSTNGVRQGLANLPTPPCPFGTQLEPSSSSSRSTPYTHSPPQHRRRFDPRPTRRALSVENDEVPRPDPDEFYTTLLSAYQSVKNLAGVWGEKAAAILTDNGKKDLTTQLVKVGLGVVVVCRPRWVLATMNCSLAMLRDPWRLYHHTFYTAVIARVLFS